VAVLVNEAGVTPTVVHLFVALLSTEYKQYTKIFSIEQDISQQYKRTSSKLVWHIQKMDGTINEMLAIW
jgi:hypothetical protein